MQRPTALRHDPLDPHTPFDPPAPYLERYDATRLPGPLFRESDVEAQAALAGVDFQTTCRHPQEFDARQIKAAYYAMIELLDDALGRMVQALERSGQRERTIVIYTSDHGEMMGDHGLLLKGCRFYEGLVRVPLIMSWPGHFRNGLVSDALVELTDIMPTLLDACGVRIPARVQGRSLQGILTGASDSHEHRDSVRSEYYHVLSPDSPEGKDKRMVGSYSTMLRTRQYKLIVHHGHEVGELFDMQNDPGEFTNLWDAPQYADLRFNLLKGSFDALAHAVDLGPAQTRWY
jgi:arylsulfatase